MGCIPNLRSSACAAGRSQSKRTKMNGKPMPQPPHLTGSQQQAVGTGRS
jgi:hypothetical protein